jgi:hypothetical protein
MLSSRSGKTAMCSRCVLDRGRFVLKGVRFVLDRVRFALEGVRFVFDRVRFVLEGDGVCS